MSNHHNKRAKEILQKIIYATVATASKQGVPHNSPVAHLLDDDLNLYWFSDKQSQHSKNIRENEDVFIVIYDSTAPEGDGEGVYLKAKAYEVNDPAEIDRAFAGRKGYSGKPDDYLGDKVRRTYKAIPQQAWMNDAEMKDGRFVRDFRVEVAMQDLTS